MRKAVSILVTLVFFFSLTAAFAAAAEQMKGTIKAVDEKAGTVTFCPEGTTKDHVMKVGKDVDIKSIKPDTKVEISVEDNRVTNVKKIKKRMMIEGC
jgi:carbon monoxide dehydrogenase subunit G